MPHKAIDERDVGNAPAVPQGAVPLAVQEQCKAIEDFGIVVRLITERLATVLADESPEKRTAADPMISTVSLSRDIRANTNDLQENTASLRDVMQRIEL